MDTDYKNKSDKYGPNQREFLEATTKKPIACSPTGDCIHLPNHVEDPIVTNNIAYMEFDYTYNGGEDIPVVDEDENLHHIK